MPTLLVHGWRLFDDPPLNVTSEVVGVDPTSDDSDSTYVRVAWDVLADAGVGTCDPLAPGGPVPYDVRYVARLAVTDAVGTTTVGMYVLGTGSAAAIWEVAAETGFGDYTFSLRDYLIENALDIVDAMTAARTVFETTATDFTGFQSQVAGATVTMSELRIEVIYDLATSIDGSLKLVGARFGRTTAVRG